MTDPLIKSVDHYINKSGVKALVYGRSAVGKTRLVLTCQKVIMLSAEGGLRSLAGNNIATYPPITTLAELITAYNWLYDNKGAAAQFQTVYIDSLTEIAEVILNTSKDKFKDGRLAYQDAYDIVFNKAIRKFRDLPNKNVIFTAKEDYEKDNVTGIQSFMPAMPSKAMRAELPYFFDNVFRMVAFTDATTGSTYSALQCGIDQYSFAKDRSGTLDHWERPDLTAIFNKMNGQGR